ncbi:hypothetical protein RUM44_006152 [Polyplax serrata]|uniref:Protein AATF n=1 Tax=Polyplax serrata TaxID=468196 RepID=A0ABR1AZ35_POLSC
MSKKSTKKNCLSERLTSLIQTKPKDIESGEEDDFVTEEKITVQENDTDVSADELGTTKLRKINKKFLDEDDEKYLGKTISRKDLDDFHGQKSDSEESDNENKSGDGSSEDVDEDENGSDDRELENETGDDESDYENEDDLQKTSGTEVRSSTKKQAIEPDLNKEIFTRVGKDLEKGKAIKTQLLVWDFLLECRMKLQNCIVASNQLPSHKNVSKFKGNAEYNESVQETKKSIKHLLKSLMSLQEALLSSNEEFITSVGNEKKHTTESDSESEINSDSEVEDDVSGKGNLRNKNFNIFASSLKKLNDFSNEISKRHKNFESYRNNVIQKWDDKTRIDYVSNKNFGAFEQSVLKQIHHVLMDKNRLITRTQTKRSSYHILGTDTGDEPPAKKPTVLEEEQSDIMLPQKSKTVTNKEIYDDDDFYHQLLSELIKRKASNITDPVQLGRQWMQLQKIRSKMKKTVDTRASKARKVRFVVHPKLVNFMMPTGDSIFHTTARVELINSIFGKKK